MGSRAGYEAVEKARAVVRLIMRDVVSPLFGFSMLGYEMVFEKADRPWFIVAALTLLGYPVADRVDKFLKGANGGSGGTGGGNGNRKGGNDAAGRGGRVPEEDDPYSGPGGYYRQQR